MIVNDLTNEGDWGQRGPLTTMVDYRGKERVITFAAQYKDVDWESTADKCYSCYTIIPPEAWLFRVENAWVLPCRNCKQFVWYDKSEEVI